MLESQPRVQNLGQTGIDIAFSLDIYGYLRIKLVFEVLALAILGSCNDCVCF